MSFRFKEFSITQEVNPMKVGTDSVLLGAWANAAAADSALDIGTGTGILALMLAQNHADIRVTAVDLTAEIIGEARLNVERSPWCDRVDLVCQPIQDFARLSTDVYDYIISNPPFFTGGTFTMTAQREQVRHTTKLSHFDLLNAVYKLLSMEGKFALILPYIEGVRFCELAKKQRFFVAQTVEVYTEPTDDAPVRLLIELTKKEVPTVTEKLVLYENRKAHQKTAAYIELTKHFYLK